MSHQYLDVEKSYSRCSTILYPSPNNNTWSFASRSLCIHRCYSNIRDADWQVMVNDPMKIMTVVARGEARSGGEARSVMEKIEDDEAM